MSCKAWTYSHRGTPNDILTFTTIPIPTLPSSHPKNQHGSKSNGKEEEEEEEEGETQWLLVKIAFAALNPGSLFQMSLIPPLFRHRTCVPEMDLSGTVVDTWPSCEEPDKRLRFKKGDKIAAMVSASYALSSGQGALSTYILLPSSPHAVHKPPFLPFADAAACLLTGMTAHLLIQEARLPSPSSSSSSSSSSGPRVLIHGASGGIGTLTVQMARAALGPSGLLIAICSARNAPLVRSLGADTVIDYTQVADLPSHLTRLFSASPFHAIIDCLGNQSLYASCSAYLLPTGCYSTVGIKPADFSPFNFLRAVAQMKLNEWWPRTKILRGTGRSWRPVSMMQPTLEDRQRIMDMLERGELKVVRDSIWPFEKADEAYRKLAGLHARGKILVKVDDTMDDDEC